MGKRTTKAYTALGGVWPKYMVFVGHEVVPEYFDTVEEARAAAKEPLTALAGPSHSGIFVRTTKPAKKGYALTRTPDYAPLEEYVGQWWGSKKIARKVK
jgi:hypothetical protein